MLRAEAEKLGFTSGFTIYDTADSKSLLKTIIKELQLDDKVYKPAVIHGRISFAKNNLLTADKYQSNGDLYKADSAARIPRIGDIYALYASRCRQANAMSLRTVTILIPPRPNSCFKLFSARKPKSFLYSTAQGLTLRRFNVPHSRFTPSFVPKQHISTSMSAER